KLQYRSLKFEQETLDMQNYQGSALVNYTEREIPYTRIIEHKHFEFGTQPKTVITHEFPAEWNEGNEPFYPINDQLNTDTYKKYKELADKESNVIFGGRLAEYRYYDMHQIIGSALKKVETHFE
ncbi:MAG: UDP-galactopyranose mutase, partial [Sphingobacteriaceae bacterium]